MSTAKPSATKIAERIKKHRKIEEEQRIRNAAIGYANVYYFNTDKDIWLVNSPNNRGTKVSKDGFGNPVVIQGPLTTLEGDGYVVWKNTKIGETIIKNTNGEHKVKTPKGPQLLIINNKASFVPSQFPDYAIDVSIFDREGRSITYSSLRHLLDKVTVQEKRIEKARTTLEEEKDNDEIKRKRLIKEIESAEKAKEDAVSKIRTFIRRNAELRYQPILDQYQEDIKRSDLYTNTIAINGGPGTGKTTSLIQRIKFLTDPVAIEDYASHIPEEQKQKLLDKNSWIFFSPSELLKQFLKNSMTQEGLLANDDSVKVWSNYKSTILKRYHLINPETQNPFLILRKYTDTNLLPITAKSLLVIIDEFEHFYVKHQLNKIFNLISHDVRSFSWYQLGKSIQAYFENQKGLGKIDNLIRTFINIQENYTDEVLELSKKLDDILNKNVAELYLSLEKEPVYIELLQELFDKWENERNQDNSEPDDNEIEEENIQKEDDFKNKLLKRLKALLRKLSIKKYDNKQRLSKEDHEILKYVHEVAKIDNLDQFERLGELVYFKKYFEKLTQGIVPNLITEIPSIYKQFRKITYREKQLPFNVHILNIVVNEDNNKRIHPDEQSFLIFFINKLIKNVSDISADESKKIKHSYFEAYRELKRSVIGIDEATDFHLVDLLCIYSFRDNEISSVTLSGDLMQRITAHGLTNWQDLKLFIPDFKVKELLISYRQSPTLLNIAQTLYKKATRKNAKYISYMEADSKEPKPLLFVNEQEQESIVWISNRIIEIYKAYDNQIPSIAVFLPTNENLETFSNKLAEIDKLADFDIRVLACNDGRVLGDKNTVRVFSVEYIKGLEFEAVFFHNIHQIKQNKDINMVFKNLYVGLSRATFYLGITSKTEIPEISELPNICDDIHDNWEI